MIKNNICITGENYNESSTIPNSSNTPNGCPNAEGVIDQILVKNCSFVQVPQEISEAVYGNIATTNEVESSLTPTDIS